MFLNRPFSRKWDATSLMVKGESSGSPAGNSRCNTSDSSTRFGSLPNGAWEK